MARRKIQRTPQFRGYELRRDVRGHDEEQSWVAWIIFAGFAIAALGSAVFNCLGHWFRLNPEGTAAGVVSVIIAAVLICVTIGAEVSATFSFERFMKHWDAAPRRPLAAFVCGLIFVGAVTVCLIGGHSTFEAIEHVRQEQAGIVDKRAALTSLQAERERMERRLNAQEGRQSASDRILAQAEGLTGTAPRTRGTLNSQALAAEQAEANREDARDQRLSRIDRDIAKKQQQLSAYKPLSFEQVVVILILAELIKAVGRWALITSMRRKEEPAAASPPPVETPMLPSPPGTITIRVRERTINRDLLKPSVPPDHRKAVMAGPAGRA